MKKPNRISMSLFDEELKALINASAKIFPITQNDVDTNNNPGGYEYGRVDNYIYRWNNDKWEYIIADDKDILWEEIKNKPTSYVPKEHAHSELHTHANKSLLDTITESMINLWNSITNKADKTYVDTELEKKSDVTHNHDLDYADKSVEGMISNIDTRLYNVENGYTEGHSHPNVEVLNVITQGMLDAWNTITGKADKTYVDTELSKKANSTTLNGHIDNSTIHVTQTDKNNWDAKANTSSIPINLSQLNNDVGYITANDIPDVPPGYTIGTTKPTDGSMWYKVI